MSKQQVALWRDSEVIGTWVVKAIGAFLIVALAFAPTHDKGPMAITTFGGVVAVLFMSALFYFT
jgi:hypothetical protein